jgi:hypothetical protein
MPSPNPSSQYVRDVEGKIDTMVEVAPGEFVNMVSATKLGMIANPKKVLTGDLRAELVA